ncbi:hypothetical protein [Streptomyces sp. H51]|uniref:hypothetical protein n=1 Tax=Streptomyces sp. H51 TaxID=3111770 RepID=UPI003B633066
MASRRSRRDSAPGPTQDAKRRTATELLETTIAQLAPDPRANPLVPLIERGAAPRETLAALALEQGWVIPADRRAFLHLARRAVDRPETAAFFTTLAEG